MPPRRAMRGGPWSEVVDVSESEDLSDEMVGIVMEDSSSSWATGQSGCVDQPWLPRRNKIPLRPPSPYGLNVYSNEREEIIETEPEEDPGEDPVENSEEEQFMFSPEQSPMPIFGPRLLVYIDILSDSAMSLERVLVTLSHNSAASLPVAYP